MTSLYHIARESRVEQARRAGVYTPSEFDADGFIHCSYARQLKLVAARSWSQDPWVLLEIDPASVASHLIEENLEGGTDLFPHLYCKLPITAILAIHPLTRDSDTGQLTLPDGVVR